jgi:epoxyqueuosine reductase
MRVATIASPPYGSRPFPAAGIRDSPYPAHISSPVRPMNQSPSITSAAADLVAAIRAEAKRLGFARVGIAAAGPPPRQDVFRTWIAQGHAGVMEAWLRRHEPLRGDPTSLLPGARSVIMLATDYSTGEATPSAATAATAHPADPAEQGRGKVSRYAWGDDYHDLLRSRVNALAGWLQRQVPDCTTRGVVDSAPLAEREFGRLTGLGWFGKNTMLIHPAAGSFFFLTGLLTDLVLPVDEPIEVDHCGTCTACLDACPTGALPAPRVLDARKCISALTIEDHGPVSDDLRPGLGDWVFGCDICQDVCPWNRHAPVSDEPAFQPRGGETTLSLAEILMLDDDGFRRRFKGSPILRAKRVGLARSAAIALGNRPDPAAAAALEQALRDSEQVVRDAAAWALGQWIAKGGELKDLATTIARHAENK